jgi:hypothetical protein
MSGASDGSTQGDGYARVLLGVMGVAFAGGGMLIIWFIVTTWPVAFLAATPGLVLSGYGVNLLLACAFYDDADVGVGPLGFPVVKRIGSRAGARSKSSAGSSPPTDHDDIQSS